MAKGKSCEMGSGKSVPLKHQLVQLFWVVSPGFTRWAESHMDQPGLTPQRVRLLVLLLDNGPMMMRELRNELGVSATNVTALVDALEKDGMVARKAHGRDRRITMIVLTAKGEKRLTENCSEFKDRVSGLFSGLSASEQKQFLALLHKMRATLIAKNILKPCDPCVTSTPPPARARRRK